jgi:hypothetical protein
MDFYEVLEQVLVLLQRHGRVSYRALKRQFNLDDDDVEGLKGEHIPDGTCRKLSGWSRCNVAFISTSPRIRMLSLLVPLRLR